MEDYYKILGVDKSASEEEIKKAYRKLAHQFHPDRPGGDAEKFKKINEAYQVLSNREKRAQYDRFGRVFSGGDFSTGGGQTPGWDFGFSFDAGQFEDLGNISDIFDAFFEGLGVKSRKKTYYRGSDVEVVQEIELEDAFRGVTKKIIFTTLVKCEHCSGQGYDDRSGLKKCGVCDGQGEIRETRHSFFGNFSQVKTCVKCWGTGQVPEKVCKQCGGSGRVRGEREVLVNIVAGVRDGQIIKIAGAGEAGERGAAAGDLYVRVHVKPHPVFERRGDDLFIKKEIGLLDILLGKTIEFKSIAGEKLSVEIPTGFNLREKLRLPGQGMPRFGSLGYGDLYVILDVKTPKHLNAKARKLLEELKKEIE